MNTYLSLAIIVAILIAAIVFSLRRARNLRITVSELSDEYHATDT